MKEENHLRLLLCFGRECTVPQRSARRQIGVRLFRYSPI
jgi:hypothetical protein